MAENCLNHREDESFVDDTALRCEGNDEDHREQEYVAFHLLS